MFLVKKEQLCKSKRNTDDFWGQLPPEQEGNWKKEAVLILSGKPCLAPLWLGEICLCINRATGE